MLDQDRSTVLSGTEHDEGPFFSPDGEWIGFFADGQAVLFNSYYSEDEPENARIEIISLATGARKAVARGYYPRDVRRGHLVFVRQNTLSAAAFDLARLELRGTPQPAHAR
jgi:WD40-like Beta Propeller Repeat